MVECRRPSKNTFERFSSLEKSLRSAREDLHSFGNLNYRITQKVSYHFHLPSFEVQSELIV